MQDWAHPPSSNSSSSSVDYSIFTKPIEKSPHDDREYRIIKLANGLRATVIHDPTADKAAASLDVAVGHLYDPDDMPGLAHFCEHLLFMGTEQFPKENEYSEFLSKNNGSSNAYTSTSNTNYHFSVATSALSGALARFSGFFHSPLFAPSCTSRELNAVDSEHKKNHQNDMWRIFQLNKHLSKEGHVWSKFGSGNRESLSRAGKLLKAKGKLSANGSGIASPRPLNLNSAPTPSSLISRSASASLAPSPIPSRMASPALSVASVASEAESDGGAVGRETRRRLEEWWSKEYCASRMKLCVIGKEPLDELTALVSELFSPIQNRGQDPLPMINEHPFGPDEIGTLVSVQTILDFHAVEISFPLGYQPPLWKYKPGNFLGHFVGHEGRGSLHSYLKNKGWITALSAGPQSLGRGFSMFKITTQLTPEGFKNYRSVTLAIYKYLSLLRSSELPAWNQREMSMMHETRFRFKEKARPESYAVWVSEHMSWPVPQELLISAPQLVWEWEGDEGKSEGLKQVREILELMTVESGRAVLMAKTGEFEKIGESETGWEKEPIYGTQYKVEKLDNEFVAKAQSPNDIQDLFLPGPNEFMPTNLNIDKREVDEPSLRPRLIREEKLSSLWHKKDDQFWVPKGHVIIEIRTPFANDSARAAVLTRLYSELVTDALTEYSYDADLAGLRYDLGSHSLGLFITLSGYNDKLAVLAKHVLDRARNIKVDPERLKVLRQQVQRDWRNYFMGQTYKITDYYARYLLTDNSWTVEEKLQILADETAPINSDEVQAHIDHVLSKINMKILVNGNIDKEEAIRIATMAEDILSPGGNEAVAITKDDTRIIDRALVLPEASNFIWKTVAPNPNEPNSSISYYIHFGDRSSSIVRGTAGLLNQILAEPAFNTLRTKEQLGYIVHCSQWVLSGSGQFGLRIVVQSEKGPAYLESRIDAFLDGMKTEIEEMTEEAFEEQKNGMEKKLTEKIKTVGEETNVFWSHIDSGYLDFLRRVHDAETLKSITKNDVLQLFLSHVHPSSTVRSKLSVHCQSRKPKPAVVETDEDSDSEDTPAVHHPAIDEDAKRNGVTYIDSILSFKRGLAKSELPMPMVEWGDLPTSKL